MSKSRLFAAYLGDIKFEFVKMLRTPMFAVPTLIFPAMFYLIFGVLMGSARGNAQGALYAFAGLGVFGTMAPGLFGFGVSLAFERELGTLTFKQALPAPAGGYLLARMFMAMLFVAVIATMMIVLATTLGKVPLTPWQALHIFLIEVLGVLPFCAIGLTVGALVSGQAAPAIINLIYLPMAFLAGLWIPLEFLPGVVKDIAPFFPAYHLAQLARGAVGAPMLGAAGGHIAALAAFTLVFFAIAVRRLSNGGFRIFGARRAGAPARKSRLGVALALAVVIGVALTVSGVFGGKSRPAQAASAATETASAATDAPASSTPAGVPAPDTPVISDFDAGSATAAYGEGWYAAGDDMRGGNSKATQRVLDGGAQNSKESLEVSGTVGDAIQYPFAGTAFFPHGTKPQEFTDYSGKKTLSFYVRGDGRQYMVMFLSGLQVDAIPAMSYFQTGPQWQEVRVSLSELGALDLKRVHGILIGTMGPTGDFKLQIDNVQLR
jgi:ABC-2 type transport system permease protein